MKKILCAVMALVMLAAMLVGCGSTSNNGGNENPGNTPSDTETVANEPVKITEKYTFEDPTDIEFDKRYVIA